MPRFVLLEHCWNEVHWDLMLEVEPGGPLRTWAIDAEVVAGKELPARGLADHRSVYLDYEGEVSGGRGTVRRVDGGEYDRLTWTPDHVRVRLFGTQLAGLAVLRRAVAGEKDDSSSSWTFRLGNFD
jgi:hypothetical protein